MNSSRNIAGQIDTDVIAVVYLVVGVVATAVFSNQTDPALQLLGRGFHILNIAASIMIAGRVFGFGLYGYVAVVAGFFALDRIAGIRLPYIVALNVLFLAAGMAIGDRWRKLATLTLVAIVIVSGVVMLLQVLGVGEWTQTLTTHGFISAELEMSKKPQPSLFVGYFESKANFLQGRPAGLLYSNQFASLTILAALSLAMFYRLPLWVDIALCVTAVLTLAKVVLLGLGLLGLFLILLGGELRKTAIRYGIITVSSLIAYALLFPGMFQIFLFSRQMLVTSFAIRFIDFAATTLGWDIKTIGDQLNKLTFSDAKYGSFSEESVKALTQAVGPRVSTYSKLAPAYPALLGASSVCLLGFLVSRHARQWLWENVKPIHISVAIALLTFGLAADFLASYVFWFLAGFAIPLAKKIPQQDNE